MAEIKRAGYEWLALNVGDGQKWDDWRTVIDRARDESVVALPWARCRTLAEVEDLLDMADLVSFHCILNIEDEFKTVLEPWRIAPAIADVPELQVGISSVAWLYNDVDFRPLGKLPMLLQLFPADNRWMPDELPEKQADCVRHAREHGFTYVGVTLQTYGTAQPGWYGYWKGVRSLYTGDDVGSGNWGEWS